MFLCNKINTRKSSLTCDALKLIPAKISTNKVFRRAKFRISFQISISLERHGFFKIKITRKVKQSFHCVCEDTKFRMVRNIVLYSLWGKSEIKGLVCENNNYNLMCPCSGASLLRFISNYVWIWTQDCLFV